MPEKPEAPVATLAEAVQCIVEALQPRSAIEVTGAEVPPLGIGASQRLPPTEASRLLDLPFQAPVDLAVVDSAAELVAEEVPIALSRLRDLLARRVLVIVRAGAAPAWSRRALIGCGYTHYCSCRHQDELWDLYQFDIATYKPTPDWLNSRNWANPELWDEYRW